MSNIKDLKNKYERYVTFDEPIPYWSHSILEKDRCDENQLLFYPVMIKDMFDFYRYSDCLMTDHQSIPDAKILSMTCYEYLYYETIKEKSQNPYIHMFSLLLSVCLRSDKFKKILLKNNLNEFISMFDKKDDMGKPAFMINQVLYDSLDFDNLKDLIAFQNDLDLPDVNKSREFREAIEKARKQRMRILGSGEKMGDLEEQLICLSLGYGLSYDDVGKVSLRKFNKMISYMNKKIHYEIYLQSALSGFVTFKEKIEHWMTTENKDKYSDVLMTTDQLNSIVDGSNLNNKK